MLFLFSFSVLRISDFDVVLVFLPSIESPLASLIYSELHLFMLLLIYNYMKTSQPLLTFHSKF